MTRAEELKAVIELACCVEDRTDREQRALLAVAWELDKDHNRRTVTNRARRDPLWQPLDLTSAVAATRVLGPDDRVVPFPKNWQKKRAEWAASQVKEER